MCPTYFQKKATIGRLFEPMTPEANLKVYEAMVEIFGNHRNTLMGVNDYMVADNEWVYSSGKEIRGTFFVLPMPWVFYPCFCKCKRCCQILTT